ncbi:hypothetical protein ACIRD3_07265 [Kitasatospora sp. NPDC093550]|uniref:hypothetical protein n=1 Tax=Kitasatospora sp. NPDC093550 TaxID=3364089 RepID=UPI003811CE6A
MTMSPSGAARTLAPLVLPILAPAFALAAAAPAHAQSTPVPATASAADLSAARQAAQDPQLLDTLGRFFARKGVPPTGPATDEEVLAAKAAAPALTGATIPVYHLDPAFVTGTPGTQPAKLVYLATKAVSADGQAATVWTAPRDGSWRVVNIASGSEEEDYAARADGATVFTEPQIHATYAVHGDHVLPLNAEAARSIGADGTTLAFYQRLVRHRYADKLPGSAYDRAGIGGGFSPDDRPAARFATASPAPVGAVGPAGAGTAALATVLLASLLVRRRARRA